MLPELLQQAAGRRLAWTPRSSRWRGGVGLVGASGSYESFSTNAPIVARPYRTRQFPRFPNPHVRTNAFMLSRELMLGAAMGPDSHQARHVEDRERLAEHDATGLEQGAEHPRRGQRRARVWSRGAVREPHVSPRRSAQPAHRRQSHAGVRRRPRLAGDGACSSSPGARTQSTPTEPSRGRPTPRQQQLHRPPADRRPQDRAQRDVERRAHQQQGKRAGHGVADAERAGEREDEHQRRRGQRQPDRGGGLEDRPGGRTRGRAEAPRSTDPTQAWAIPTAIGPAEATITTRIACRTSIASPTIASWR